MTRKEFMNKYSFKQLRQTMVLLPYCDICQKEIKSLEAYYITPFNGTTTPAKLCKDCYEELKKEHDV